MFTTAALFFHKLSLHYPARGRKQAGHCAFCNLVAVNTFAPLPRKGTETPPRNMFSRRWLYPTFAPLPRKGTETLEPLRSAQAVYAACFRSITPQGDGNNLSFHLRLFWNLGCAFAPLPRKGTETPHVLLCAWVCSCVTLSLHYPARGRKPAVWGPHRLRDRYTFAPLPRKGTETAFCRLAYLRLASIFPPLPRKGTETKRMMKSEVGMMN